MLTTSDPAFGSLIASAPRCSPETSARQVLLFLLRRAEAPQLVHAQIRVRAVRQAHGGRRATHFLHRNAVREVAHRDAAVLGLHRDAQQAEFAELRPQRAGKLVASDRSRAASGAISFCANAQTDSRSMSIVSPRPKSNAGRGCVMDAIIPPRYDLAPRDRSADLEQLGAFDDAIANGQSEGAPACRRSAPRWCAPSSSLRAPASADRGAPRRRLSRTTR